MTRPSLAGIEQRAAAATEGPWEATQDKCWGEKYPSLSIQRVSEYTDYDPAHAGCEPLDAEDAAFIAAARTDVPTLTAAVRDVLALHTDGGQSQGYTDDAPGGYGYIDHCCTECGSFGEFGEPWPCPTVRALAAHLDLTD